MSPSKKRDRMDDLQHKVAVSIILTLIDNYDLDILCLGEVSPKDIKYLDKLLGNNFNIYDGTFKNSHSRIIHDMCVIYKKEKLAFLGDTDITKPNSILGPIRAGIELHFQHIQTGQDFFVYTLHWPSRTTKSYEEETHKRYELGSTVREAIDNCIIEKKGEFYIILGDFNDEPFSKSITEGIGATRDRRLLRRKPELLYNPFWRHIGHPIAFPNTDHETMSCGTCYSSAELTTNWATFDQILFSSSFLTSKTWNLNEESVKIVRDFELEKIVYNSRYFIDHLPVVASIESLII